MFKVLIVSLFLVNLSFVQSAFSKELAIMPVENEAIVYKGVVDFNDEATADKLFGAADAWLKKSMGLRKIGGKQNTMMMLGGQQTHTVMGQLEADMRSREKFLSKKLDKELSYKFLQYYHAQKGFSIRTLLIDANLTLQFKDGKYRYKLDGFDYQHYNHYTGNQQRIYGMGDKCGTNGSLHQLQSICNKATGNRKKALTALDKDINQFIEEMTSGILAELTPQEDEDW